ncbi:MAG: hypothetical protein WCS96_02585 [Victivallales bacterium]
MNPLKANLSAFYKCRPLPYWCLFSIVMGLIVIFGRYLSIRVLGHSHYYLSSYLLSPCFFGAIVANTQFEILSKPFTFCLPGHRWMPRQVVFTAGIIINCVFALLIVLTVPLGSIGGVLQCLISALLTGMAFYLLGAGLAAIPARYVWIPIFLAYFLLSYPGIHLFLDRLILFHPLLALAIATPIILLAWKLLGNPEFARNHCGRFCLGFGNIFNPRAVRHLARERFMSQKTKTAPATTERGVKRFFLSIMKRFPYLSASRTAMGALCSLELEVGAGDRVVVGIWALALLIPTIFLGYSTHVFIQNIMLFVIPFTIPFVGANFPTPFFSSLLLPTGRRGRFVQGITISVAFTYTVFILIVLQGFVSHALHPFLPALQLHGNTVLHHPIELRLLYLLLILTPVLQTVLLIGKNSLRLAVIICGLIMGFGGYFLFPLMSHSSAPAIIVTMIVVANAVNFALIAFCCFRCDLVGDGAGILSRFGGLFQRYSGRIYRTERRRKRV